MSIFIIIERTRSHTGTHTYSTAKLQKKIDIRKYFSVFLRFFCLNHFFVVSLQRKNVAIMKKTSLVSILLLGFLVLETNCSHQVRQYKIAVSQCSDDAWRRKMNEEMERELLFHPSLQLSLRQANANSALQCKQIDSLIMEKPDLLIVSPNEADEVEPAITRAYLKGIPVVVADRKVNGNYYTAFVGGDNYEVGQIVAQYIRDHWTDQPCTIFEIEGLPGSTPAVLRHKGLVDGLATSLNFTIVAKANGEWFEEPGYAAAKSLLRMYGKPDFIVAQNDLMGIGARRAVEEVYPGENIHIIGVDALTGEGLGIDAICDGILEASATYASRGDLVIQTAEAILSGKPFVRDNNLSTTMIDLKGAIAMQQYANEMEHRVETIQLLQNKISELNETISMQKMVVYASISIVVLLVILFVILWKVVSYRKRVHQERERTQRTIQEQQQRLESMSTELARVQATATASDKFMQQLMREIEVRMADTDLNVNTLSDALHISRAQLFRKTKALTGCSPVDLIRSIRLKRGQQMLLNTDETIQQIAYAVGFTSASYFTKCYKDLFNISPCDVKRPK